jgi:hypothetical protein
VAVSVSRCCGGGSIDRTCAPSNAGAARGRTTTGLGVVVAMCLLVLGLQVDTARAADAPPPLIPPAPTIAVQVSVSIPTISVNVQVGAVAVSVSTAPVDVSVSTSTSGAVPSPDAPVAAPQPTANEGSGDCCEPAAPEVHPAAAAARKSRPARTLPPQRPAPPPTRAVANSARTHTIRAPRVERPTRSLTVKKVSRRVGERPATRPKARRGCCERAQPPVVAVARMRAGPPQGVRLALDRQTGAAVRSAAQPGESATDNRLLLQLGVLAAFLYLVCLAGWYAATRPRRRRA